MAAYQAGPYIGEALASIGRQTMDDLEVLVVDDGSTDATAAVVRAAARHDRRIQLVSLPRNRGQAAALNVGAERARGRYLAILDADDEATPGRLEQQLALLARQPELVLVGGAVKPWREGLRRAGPIRRYARDDASIRVRSLFKSEFISGAMTLDRERMVRHGLRFDERRRLGVDWALSLQAMRVGRVANLAEVVMRYRIHPVQLTAGLVDGLRSDGTRIRVEALARLGLRPTEAELRTHLAVSPCDYWPFGENPGLREMGASVEARAERWFRRLRRAVARSGWAPAADLDAYLDQIRALLAERDSPGGAGLLARGCSSLALT
jgi:glycosyltransferase involved in cell wall biosynthesis